MRDDVSAIAEGLTALCRRKLQLIEQLRGNTAALRSFMLSGDDPSIDDICVEDEAIILEADGIDADIARLKDELSRITGLAADEALARVIEPSREGKEIDALRVKIDSILSEMYKEREEIIRTMKSKSESFRRSADELEAMAKLREYTPTKEPLL